MRVVLDTNVIVRANPRANPAGLARELLVRVISAPHVLVTSAAILQEVGEVLRYPHVKARWPLSGEQIETFVGLLEAASVLVVLPREIPAVVSDPDDDPILQTAILGGADVLCSRDAAFRAPGVAEVCRAHGIRVLDDIELIGELRQTG